MFCQQIKGLVNEVGKDENLGKVKVRFPQFDDLISDWLPVMQSLTFDAKTWAVPRKETLVIVLSQNHDDMAVAATERDMPTLNEMLDELPKLK